MPFSVEAEIPPEWECKVCGAQALLVDGDGPEEKKAKPARTHWDMLMERRTREELEEVLEERLAVLRSGAMNIAVHPRDSRSLRNPSGGRAAYHARSRGRRTHVVRGPLVRCACPSGARRTARPAPTGPQVKTPRATDGKASVSGSVAGPGPSSGSLPDDLALDDLAVGAMDTGLLEGVADACLARPRGSCGRWRARRNGSGPSGRAGSAGAGPARRR